MSEPILDEDNLVLAIHDGLLVRHGGAEAKALKEAIPTWSAFAEKHGSFADEHSTL